jgi:pimeloyl-ACP methyl ester carboxylesterase
MGEFLRRSGGGDAVANFFRVCVRLDVREDALQIRVPTLVIHARDDLGVPLEGGRRLAAFIPGSQLQIVEGGHREGTASTAAVRRRALDFFALDDGPTAGLESPTP